MAGITTIVAHIEVPSGNAKSMDAARMLIHSALVGATEELRELGMAPTEAILVGSDSNGAGISVPIGHWNPQHPSNKDGAKVYEANLSDQRRLSNQLYLAVRKSETSEEDDFALHVTGEVNSFDNDSDAVPCLHVATSDVDGTLSLFRSADGLVMRLDAGLRLQAITMGDNNETVYLIA